MGKGKTNFPDRVLRVRERHLRSEKYRTPKDAAPCTNPHQQRFLKNRRVGPSSRDAYLKEWSTGPGSCSK